MDWSGQSPPPQTCHPALLRYECGTRAAMTTFQQRFQAGPGVLLAAGAGFCIGNLGKFGLVDVRGFEPLTPCLQSRCSPS